MPYSPFAKPALTANNFEALLCRLDPDREQAGKQYEELRWKLIRFFRWGSCVHAEDLVDETFNRVAEKIVAGKREIQQVVGFVWGVAKLVRREAIRRGTKTIRLPDLPGGEESFAGQDTDRLQHELAASKRRLKCLRKCIQELSAEDRRLLLEYHSPRGRLPETRRRLAAENGITLIALRVRANRLRCKLEEYIKDSLSRSAD